MSIEIPTNSCFVRFARHFRNKWHRKSDSNTFLHLYIGFNSRKSRSKMNVAGNYEPISGSHTAKSEDFCMYKGNVASGQVMLCISDISSKSGLKGYHLL